MKPACSSVGPFIKAHLGKQALAPLTGQDSRALAAFAHLVELYAQSDDHGRICAIWAMRYCIEAAQRKVWPLFQKAIPHGLDWSDEQELWATIAPGKSRAQAAAEACDGFVSRNDDPTMCSRCLTKHGAS